MPRLRLCPLYIGDNLGDIGDKYENTHCRPYAADKGIEFCLAYHGGKSPLGFNGSAVAETAFQAALLYHKGSPKDGFRIYISFCTDGLAGYLLHL
ncbi:hypothetical protein [Kingella oralis]